MILYENRYRFAWKLRMKAFWKQRRRKDRVGEARGKKVEERRNNCYTFSFEKSRYTINAELSEYCIVHDADYMTLQKSNVAPS